MQRPFSYKLLNKFINPFALLILLSLWQLEFRHTVKSILVYKQHHEATSAGADLAHNSDYLKTRMASINQNYMLFQVEPSAWNNDFWSKISRIAFRKNIDVIYKPELAASSDTSIVLKQSIKFQGKYESLISLLDSVDKLEKVGRISHLKMYSEKLQHGESSTIALYMQFFALRK